MVNSTENDDERVPTEVMEAIALASFGAVLELVECLATNDALTHGQLGIIHDRLVEPLDMVANRDDPAMCLLRDAADTSFAKSRIRAVR
jgi:hypothetical protein